MSKRQPYASTVPAEGSLAAATAAKVFWKNLLEKTDPQAAQEAATAEFPLRLEGVVTRKTVAADDAAPASKSTVTRRSLFKFGAGATAISALEACRRPVEKMVPYTKQAEYSTPGLTFHYATARAERGDVIGLVAEVHENRPTKLEGNPEHSGGRGTTDLRTQASIFDLYDPDRSGEVSKLDGQKRVVAKPEEFNSAFGEKLKALAADNGGAKLRFLAEPSISPTFLRLRDAVKAKFPQATFHTYAAVSENNVREGARIAFGRPVSVVYDLAQAHCIVALDSDFLQTESGMLRHTRGFALSRKLHTPNDGMSRLYVVEPHYTTTGANADHRLRLPAGDIEDYLLALGKELGSKGVDVGGLAGLLGGVTANAAIPTKWVQKVAAELLANKGRGVIMIGSRQPARVHALAHALNQGLGNLGSVVHLYQTTDVNEPDHSVSLKSLIVDIDAKKVDTLVILGGNPAYDAPADFGFAEKVKTVPTTVRLSTHLDETAVLSTWHVPRTHGYEEWNDLRAADGTLSILQPLMGALHGGRSDNELLAFIAGEPATSGGEVVKATIRSHVNPRNPRGADRVFDQALRMGVVQGAMNVPFNNLSANLDDIVTAFAKRPAKSTRGPSDLEVNFLPCPRLLDGRHANNPWLLELPDPMSKVVWDNAAYVSAATAAAIGVDTNDVIKLSKKGGGSIEIPVCIVPGQADNSITVHLGWGRTHAGRYGGSPEHAADDRFAWQPNVYPIVQFHPNNGQIHGFDVYPLRNSDGLGFADGYIAEKTGKTYTLVTTHEHHTMEGRPIAIDTTLAEYKKTPDFPQWKSPDPKVLPLWTPVDYSHGHKWGMVIDLATCTGCNACVIACQAENNIAVVGKDQVSRGREMYWMRIDRYYIGDEADEPEVAYQPVACVHCEQAPCENVCPVNATAHSPEGLNDMAYNRCVGTRYCANNCPYKVRRFNYLEFQGDPLYGDIPETVKMQFNPNVTVRMRGVMEKCSYCVQRIQEGKIAALRESREMKDGDVISACAQACPTQAIVFGDLNDKAALVTRLYNSNRGYHLLAELGTHPRTLHLGKVRNPNPEMA
jgi:molybdopterin-containing oxidoreductase family iron-sulfur binding subunit